MSEAISGAPRMSLSLMRATVSPPAAPPSHPENLRVARLDLLALRLHGDRVGFHGLDGREGRAAGAVLDLRVERAVGEIDEDLLALDAVQEVLEQPRGVRVGRAPEDAGLHDDLRRALGGIHGLHRPSGVAV